VHPRSGFRGEHGVALAPAVPGWDEFALGSELRAAFGGADVRLATDVKAAAQAEAEHGALVDCDPGIYLNLGTGLAVAIVVGGRVIDGRHRAAGEIGYNLRSVADVGLGSADRRPLEDAVSGYALLRDALAVAPEAGNASEVFARARYDPVMGEVLRSFVAELSFHVVNLAIAVDPARIVVGGGMVRSWHQIEVGLRSALQAAVPYPPELVPANFPYDAPLIGALALGTAAARARLSREAPAWAG
jgi:glucokinase